MTLHQDALGSLGDRAAPKRALEVVVLGEPAEHDVDRALPIVDLRVGDVGEDSALRRLLDEGAIGRVDQEDHRARSLVHDLIDQGEGMLRALSETNQCDIGTLLGGYGSDVPDVDLARDYLMPERSDHRRDERQPILALVGYQHAEMLGLAVAHRRSRCSEFSSGAGSRRGLSPVSRVRVYG